MDTTSQPQIVSVQPDASEPWSQDEGVLYDVLEQLDIERSKRAEAESKLKQVSDELVTEKSKSKRVSSNLQAEGEVSRKAFVSMESQLKGFKELVEALTAGNPAVAAAAQADRNASPRRRKEPSLPIHVVRLLEVMPWNSRSQEYIFGHEDVFEWQVFDAKEERWQSSLRFFPMQFKTLNVVKANGGQPLDKEKNILVFLAGGDKSSSTASKFGVLTDARISLMYKIEDGFPLPQDGGTWEWIGGWRVDKQVTPSVDCDAEGWSYAADFNHFLQNSGGFNQRESDGNSPSRNFRRRKWTRRRVLIDYPLASERTRHYLKLLAENARLSVTAAKLSEQVGQIKSTLTETEMKLAEMTAAVEGRKSNLKAMDVDGSEASFRDGELSNPLQDFFSKNDQVKELGSKIKSWVKNRNVSGELQQNGASKPGGEIANRDDDQEKLSDGSFCDESQTHQKFQWKNLGRGALIEKLARPTPPPKRANSQSTVETKSSVLTDEAAKPATISGEQ